LPHFQQTSGIATNTVLTTGRAPPLSLLDTTPSAASGLRCSEHRAKLAIEHTLSFPVEPGLKRFVIEP